MEKTRTQGDYLKMIRQIIRDLDANLTVEADSDLTQDLGLSSLDQMNLMIELEDLTGICIPDDVIWNIHTVRDLISYLMYPLYDCHRAFTLRELLCRRVTESPEKNALCTMGEHGLVHCTYHALWEEVCALGEAFVECELFGKKIVLIGANSKNWILAFLAIACGAGVAIPMQNRMNAQELQELLNHCEADALMYDDGMRERVGRVHIAAKYRLENIPTLIERGKTLLAAGAHRFADTAPSFEDTLALMYTSGTSGDKKGVLLTQQAVLFNAYNSSRLVKLDGDTANFLPLHHIFGLFSAILVPWFYGQEVFVSQGAGFLLHELKAYSPVFAIMVPIMLETLKKRMQGKSPAEGRQILGGRLHHIVCGGAAMNPELLEFFKGYGVTVMEGYGMTETGPVIAVNRNDWVKTGSCGQILPGLSVRIDHQNDSGVGELLVCADQIMEGYFRDDAANEAAIQHNWFHTGDLGYLDADDFLFLTGRCKNLIVLSNGENVSPEELESALIAFSPYVQECVVFAEQEQLSVRVFPNADALRADQRHDIAACIRGEVMELNRTLPSFKHLRRVEVVDAPLPHTASGKLQRSFVTI